jgi:hypothetical protein
MHGNAGGPLFHYTNDAGYKGISSQPTWLFKASKPPGDHRKGAYFTTLVPGTKNLAKRLFVRGGADKVRFVFSFSGDEDLKPLAGGRGTFIFYSEDDYLWRRAGKGRTGPRPKWGRNSHDWRHGHRDPGAGRA